MDIEGAAVPASSTRSSEAGGLLEPRNGRAVRRACWLASAGHAVRIFNGRIYAERPRGRHHQRRAAGAGSGTDAAAAGSGPVLASFDFAPSRHRHCVRRGAASSPGAFVGRADARGHRLALHRRSTSTTTTTSATPLGATATATLPTRRARCTRLLRRSRIRASGELRLLGEDVARVKGHDSPPPQSRGRASQHGRAPRCASGSRSS